MLRKLFILYILFRDKIAHPKLETGRPPLHSDPYAWSHITSKPHKPVHSLRNSGQYRVQSLVSAAGLNTFNYLPPLHHRGLPPGKVQIPYPTLGLPVAHLNNHMRRCFSGSRQTSCMHEFFSCINSNNVYQFPVQHLLLFQVEINIEQYNA